MLFVYIKPSRKKALRNVYVYRQKARHSSKSKTFSVLFLFMKSPTFYVTWFSWKFWNWHWYIYKKHYIENFRYEKPDTSKKAGQFALCFLTYRCPDTLRYLILNWTFEIFGGGGIFTCKNQCTLRYIFICKKQCTFRYVFK